MITDEFLQTIMFDSQEVAQQKLDKEFPGFYISEMSETGHCIIRDKSGQQVASIITSVVPFIDVM